MSAPSPIDWATIPDPVFLRGDGRIAYRDPAAHYHEGLFRVFHTQVHRARDGRHYLHLGVTASRDLRHWTPPALFTPADPCSNFSSPGNVVRVGGRWLLCLQSYPTPRDEPYGDHTARLWTMESADLHTWSEPTLLPVKGPGVPVARMGRMIDPYLVEDKDEPGKWWCFYKQRGASMSYTEDFATWTPFGRTAAGENACVLVDRAADEYVLIHSPRNGIGVKRSRDLARWRDEGVLTLGQAAWPWAAGRLTAAHVLDLRAEAGVGRFVMFFHGSPPAASLALAWSDDLRHWRWPPAE